MESEREWTDKLRESDGESKREWTIKLRESDGERKERKRFLKMFLPLNQLFSMSNKTSIQTILQFLTGKF